MFPCIYQWEYFGFGRISTFDLLNIIGLWLYGLIYHLLLMPFVIICQYIHDPKSNKSMKNETEVLNNWESQPTIPLKALERTKHVLQLETIREIRGL